MAKRKRIARRVRTRKKAGEGRPGKEQSFHPLYGAGRGLIRIAPGTDLTQPADPEWAKRLDAKYGPERKK